MKFSILTVLVLMMFLSVTAQEKLPAFRIGMVNGRYFSSQRFPLKKPLLFVYFDPACEECKTFTRLLKGYQPVFQKYLVVMVTNTDLKTLRYFTGICRLGTQKSLIIGTEGWTRSLQRALGISRFPYVAVYNKNCQLVQHITAPTSKTQFEIIKATL